MKSHFRFLSKLSLISERLLLLLFAVSVVPSLAWAAGSGHADISSLFFPTINFLMYLGVMTWLYFKAIKPALQKRKAGVVESLSKAEKRLKNAEQGLNEAKARLAGVDQECKALAAKLNAETEELVRHILNDAEKDAKRIEDDIVNQVENSLLRASHEIRSEIVSSAVKKARAELKDRLSDEQDAAVREQVLAAFN
jgi:F0F1-type ATP synthase membrane subunit b/b'